MECQSRTLWGRDGGVWPPPFLRAIVALRILHRCRLNEQPVCKPWRQNPGQEGPCMRLLSFRLILSLIVGITLVSSGFSYYEVLGEKRALRSDLERRAELFGESLAGNVERAWSADSRKKADADKTLDQIQSNELQQLVQRFGNREHMLGVAIYDPRGQRVAVTPELAAALTVTPLTVTEAIQQGHEQGSFVRLGKSSSAYSLRSTDSTPEWRRSPGQSGRCARC